MRHKAVLLAGASNAIFCACGWCWADIETIPNIVRMSQQFTTHQRIEEIKRGVKVSGTIQFLVNGRIEDEGQYNSDNERLALERHFEILRLEMERTLPEDYEIELLYK